jgi:hypothetical protein
VGEIFNGERRGGIVGMKLFTVQNVVDVEKIKKSARRINQVSRFFLALEFYREF